MYGADWSGDCRRAKAWFGEHDIEHRYVDLIEEPDQVEVVLARNGGVQKIPVIVFGDDSHLVEPTNDDLAAKMAELAGLAPEYLVVDNPEAKRFEMTLVVPHVETVHVHRGNGNAARLMDGLLDILRSEGRTIVPLCGFAAGHIRDNPQHHDLLA